MLREVIICRDCLHRSCWRKSDDEDVYICKMYGTVVEGDDFCSRADKLKFLNGLDPKEGVGGQRHLPVIIKNEEEDKWKPTYQPKHY